MLIVTTEKQDIYRNLAVEEGLLNHATHLPILFLYVNAPCVVIGKNQNPWRECRLSLMEQEGVALARRISGGGAVYHDEGNLNVSMILPRAEYRSTKPYELIFQALATFGIQGSKERRNSLTMDGEKFSGQAFCFRGGRVLHHGTLLVNSDLDRLGRYLGAEVDGIQTKAVASIPAEVTNLSSFASGLNVRTLSTALIETFREMYGNGRVEGWNDGMVPEEEILPLVEKHSSTDWTLGRTPRFQVNLNGQRLEVEKGRIANLSDAPLFFDWLRVGSTTTDLDAI